MHSSEILKQQEIYTVSRLNNEVRLLLEENFPFVWVEGEISNFAAPNSGHWYFSLKDTNAQVRCAMFRQHQRQLTFLPKDGMHILIRARVSLYENRGEFQLIVEELEERGEGKLRRAFEALKKKLEAEGLFALARKKNLPLFPKQIGVITSSTGAVIRDILTVLARRLPSIPIIIYPTLVQGSLAAPSIVKAIQTANRRQECDVLILARGGGSLEDLWPFNEEIVARAIFESIIPIVAGIGHEPDFTIADFVADKRAPTPSAAAEIVTPDRLELLDSMKRHEQQLLNRMKQLLLNLQQQLMWIDKHLSQQHPKKRLTEKMQRLNFFILALIQHQERNHRSLQNKLQTLQINFQKYNPLAKIQMIKDELIHSSQKLETLMMKKTHQKNMNLVTVAKTLDGLSPLATLKRGYAIATIENRVLKNVNDVEEGDHLKLQLSQGILRCQVVEKN